VGVAGYSGFAAAPVDQAEVGPMITGGDLEAAILAVLRGWLPAYIAEGERQHGWMAGSTPTPRGWVLTGRDLQKFPADQLPAIIVMAGGIVLTPRKEGGRGVLSAFWGVEIGAVFNAAWGTSSRQHAQLYAAAIRTCLMQRPLEVADTMASVDWRGEVYDELDFPTTRTYSASVVSFNVEVREVAWADGGPPPITDPPQDPTQPLDPWTEVAQTEVTVENQPPK